MAKQWTVLVYIGADNNLVPHALVSLRQMLQVGSTDEIDIVAQADFKDKPMRRYHFRAGAQQLEQCVLNPDETKNVDSGSPATLLKFVRWGISKFRAQRYLLVLWGHGSGLDESYYWEPPYNVGKPPRNFVTGLQQIGGPPPHLVNQLYAQNEYVLPDYTSGTSLRNPQLGRLFRSLAASRRKKIDVLGFDACVMSMAEVWYEMRDGVAVGVGSEHTIPLNSWPYDLILMELRRSPHVDARALASMIVAEYTRYYGSAPHRDTVTLSACQVDDATPLANAVRTLTSQLLASLTDPAMPRTILAARLRAQHFYVPDYMDLGSFCSVLRGMLPSGSPIANACNQVQQIIQSRFVIKAASTGKTLGNAEGVSIYFPRWLANPNRKSAKIRDAIAGLGTNYARLQFVQTTRWNEFLERMLAAFKTERRSKPSANRSRKPRKKAAKHVKLRDSGMFSPRRKKKARTRQ